MEQRNATITKVASSATATQLAARTKGRKGVMITNASTAILYVALDTTPVIADAYTVAIGPSGYWESPDWATNCLINGIWASANGHAMVTEVI